MFTRHHGQRMSEPVLAAAPIRVEESRLLALGFERQHDVPTIDAVELDRRVHRVSACSAAMDTHVAITAIGASSARIGDAMGQAFEEMRRLIGVFSRFESDSALSTLNDAGRLRTPPPELAHVIDRALRYHSLTGGAFDISVAPLVDLLRVRLRDTCAPPTDAELRDVRALVGCDAIMASSRDVRLARSGIRLTLDGIAKGYIVDRMCAVLDSWRVRDYLIDAGGDVRARGCKPGRMPWTIAVRDPRGGIRPEVLGLRNAAVATSGNYERFFDPERRYHHIVDAGTGVSPTDCTSVSVVAGNTMLADALATSVFVMGPDAGLAFIESMRGCACLIIDRSGRELRSSAWKSAAATYTDPRE